ncbi:MAG: helix-turn-helix domain-containing protein, partial [Propionibacterium sp.]|nr:helix-turn-helix domain-containing protein [Propionibacterium sp.]
MTPRANPMPADQRRASIIAATRPLLAEHGLDLTTRQVAEATGIAEGTIFRHFTSKDELISAVIADSLDVDSLSADLRAIDLELPLTDRVAEAMTVLRSSFTSIHELTAALETRPQHTCVM